MARRKVELTKEEEEALQGGGNFYKFTAIGQMLVGRYVKAQKQTGNFAKADRSDYVFKTVDENKQPIEVVVNGSKLLDGLMKKTINEGLKPGNAVWLKFVENIDIGKENPMQKFSLEWDDAPPKQQAAPPPPPPKPAASEADDIPF